MTAKNTPPPLPYRVALLSGEPQGLDALFQCIPWVENGCRVVYRGRYDEDALGALLAMEPDLLLLDARAAAEASLNWLQNARGEGSTAAFILLCEQESFSVAQYFMRLGAFRYVTALAELPEAVQAYCGAAWKQRAYADAGTLHTLMQVPQSWRELLAAFPGSEWQAVFLNHVRLSDYETLARHPVLWFALKHRVLLGIFVGTPAMLDAVVRACHALASPAPRVGIGKRMRRADALEPGLDTALAAFHAHFMGPAPAVNQYAQCMRSHLLQPWLDMVITTYLSGETTEMRRLLQQICASFVTHHATPLEVCVFGNELASRLKIRMLLGRRTAPIPFLTLRQMLERFPSLTALFTSLEEALSMHATQLEENSAGNPAFSALLREMTERFAEPLSLSSLAEKHEINISYCSELFKKVTNKTYSEYLIMLRMEYAYRRIAAGERDLEKLSAECGYHNYYYFLRSFKAYFSIAPKQLF